MTALSGQALLERLFRQNTLRFPQVGELPTDPTAPPGGGYRLPDGRTVTIGPGGARFISNPAPTGNAGKPKAIEQLGGILFQDVADAERVQKENFERSQKAIGDFEGFLTENTKKQLAAAQKNEELLGGTAKRLRETGEADLAEYRKASADAIATADKYAGEAIARSGEAVKHFEDRRGQDMSAALLGLRSRMRDEEEMGGLNPDGTLKTPAQIASEQGQRREAYTNAIASAHVQIGSDYNRLGAELRTNLANITLAAGQVAVGTRVQGAQGLLAAQESRRQYEEVSATLDRVRATDNTAVIVNALQAELAGRSQIAQWTIDNKNSSIAKAGAFAQLLAAATAPGAAGVPGFEVGEGGGLRFNASYSGTGTGGGFSGGGGLSGGGGSSGPPAPRFGLGSLRTGRGNLGPAPDRLGAGRGGRPPVIDSSYRPGSTSRGSNRPR